ncbi:MAG: GNAT family N-acetyltransferase [Leptolyngbyaceae cyanobacterium]
MLYSPKTLINALILRPYTSEDWATVCRIHDVARVQELAAGGVDSRAFRPMIEVAAVDEFFDSQVTLACHADRIIGFIAWNGTYITWLYVDSEFQRCGIGWQLLQCALQQIGPGAWTHAIAGNEPAIALYRRAGLEIVETWPSDCEGYACEVVHLALPISSINEPNS